ncbi:hypothetical protein PR202_ga06519 [Eleusine coracana subsp. coracana]|uniref:Protein kinase domain-containing protein n=1 Tax=Eleusine coracana subsp. coracana TaxID=191504 RepID=A0AAV5BW94_ELECO|nr:hypothetical protein PR202_ga06519 [Eleusine coracana subsp. coracana]
MFRNMTISSLLGNDGLWVEAPRALPSQWEAENNKKKMNRVGFSGIFLMPDLRRFTYNELDSAIGSFQESSSIGRSNFSTVYKAVLVEPDGKVVAMKMLNMEQFPSKS